MYRNTEVFFKCVWIILDRKSNNSDTLKEDLCTEIQKLYSTKFKAKAIGETEKIVKKLEEKDFFQNNVIKQKSKKKKGETDNHEEDKECGVTYDSKALERILKQRIDAESIIDDNIRLLNTCKSYESYEEYIKTNKGYKSLSEVINIVLKESDHIALMPYAKEDHFIGLVFKKDNDLITAEYMDSENKELDSSIKEYLKMHKIDCMQILVEKQKYSDNCGVETVENFIWYLEGKKSRLSQDEAVKLHKELPERIL